MMGELVLLAESVDKIHLCLRAAAGYLVERRDSLRLFIPKPYYRDPMGSFLACRLIALAQSMRFNWFYVRLVQLLLLGR